MLSCSDERVLTASERALVSEHSSDRLHHRLIHAADGCSGCQPRDGSNWDKRFSTCSRSLKPGIRSTIDGAQSIPPPQTNVGPITLQVAPSQAPPIAADRYCEC